MVLEALKSLRPVWTRNETASGRAPGTKEKRKPTTSIVCHAQTKIVL